MLASGISGGLKALLILGENDNNNLKFEASPRVVHKRSTSVILSYRPLLK